MNNFDVSIIIPAYNAQDHIVECLDSIVNQTHDFKRIEVIVVDNGSSDATVKIVKENFKFDNIKVLTEIEKGVSHARNTGLRNCIGKYVMFLDADDFLSTNAVSKLIEFFNKNYDQIDVVTYTMCLYFSKEKEKVHNRMKVFTKGSAIYDVEDFFELSQTTVNVIFKNRREENCMFDTDLSVSEDADYNVQLVLCKGRLGFCSDAVYYYRKHDEASTKSLNTSLHGYDNYLYFFKKIIENYKKNGEVHKYIQGLIIYTVSWKISSDTLLPHHLKSREFDKTFEEGVKELQDVLGCLETKTILDSKTLSVWKKVYLLNFLNRNLNVSSSMNSGYAITCDNMLLAYERFAVMMFKRLKFVDNKISMLAYFRTMISNFTVPQVVLRVTDKTGNTEDCYIEMQDSSISYYQAKKKTNQFYEFTYEKDVDNISKIEFWMVVDGNFIPVKALFSRWTMFNRKLRRLKVIKGNKAISYIEYDYAVNPSDIDFDKGKTEDNLTAQLQVEDVGLIDKIKYFVKSRMKIDREILSPKTNFIRIAKRLQKKEVWLYRDTKGVYDNAMLQFKHDFEQKDGVKRYYVFDGTKEEMKRDIEKKYWKSILYFKSRRYHLNLILCKNLLISYYSNYAVYPYRFIRKYSDLIDFQVVYLGHGVLHASLLKMYAKSFTMIDKFIISSKLERDYLINKYGYSDEDLIMSGISRFKNFAQENKKTSEEKRIIFAPSWRSYLVGADIRGEREPMTKAYLNSSYYLRINQVLSSSKLDKCLKENNVFLEFQSHPNFRVYDEFFEVKSENVKILNSSIDVNDYSLLITDFSSFQFDFVIRKTPIIYFLPDEVEFVSGMHTYRELEIPFENAFGEMCIEAEGLIDKVCNIIKSNFEPNEKYLERMEDFYHGSDNPALNIYNSIKGK